MSKKKAGYICPKCGRWFRTRAGLVIHETQAHR